VKKNNKMRPIARALNLTKLAHVTVLDRSERVVEFCLVPGFFVGGNIIPVLPFVFNDQDKQFILFGFANYFSGYGVYLHPPQENSEDGGKRQGNEDRDKYCIPGKKLIHWGPPKLKVLRWVDLII
jgi:hypothetical protein